MLLLCGITYAQQKIPMELTSLTTSCLTLMQEPRSS